MFPSNHPLPAPIARFLKFSGEDPPNLGNRSLLFDRGMDRYEAQPWKIPTGGKEDFLRGFVAEFAVHPSVDHPAAMARREQTLTALKAHCVERIARTRLVVGLGLPHPTETGFLFDRITGCPYLPGSSVKGLLRAAARLVAAGELEGDRPEWTEDEIRRIFGPELGGAWTPQTGGVIFYDAFPTQWPRLEVDVLTPHHRGHTDKTSAPADWDEPNPVPFLTIAPGATFRFAFAPYDPKLEKLLDTALDWLGIGAKKAAGYGVFGTAEAAPTAQPVAIPREPTPPPPSPPAPTIKETVWTDVELGWSNNVPAAFRGNHTATCARDLLAPEILKALKEHGKRGELRGDVEVVKISNREIRLHRVLSWKKKP